MSGDFDWKNDSYKNVLIVDTSSKPNGFWVTEQLQSLIDETGIDALIKQENLFDNSGRRLEHHGVATAILTKTHSDFIDLMAALEASVLAERLEAIEHYRAQGTSQERIVSAMRRRQSRSEDEIQASELRVQFDRDQKAAIAVGNAHSDFELRLAKWEADRDTVSTTQEVRSHPITYDEEYWTHGRSDRKFGTPGTTSASSNPDEPIERSRERVFDQSEDKQALDRQKALRATLERAAEDVDRAHDQEEVETSQQQQRRRVGYSAEYLEQFARDAEQARAERGWSRDRDERDRDDGFEFER